jgi:ABC-type enterochelin transport system permease subunit
MMMLMKDSNEDTMGANYAESCYVPNHNLATDAMGTVVQESCGIQFERLVPIATKVVGLISGL